MTAQFFVTMKFFRLFEHLFLRQIFSTHLHVLRFSRNRKFDFNDTLMRMPLALLPTLAFLHLDVQCSF